MPGRVIETDLKTRLGGIVESFFKNLTPNEKELFAATSVVENLLADVQTAEQQHKAKSKSRKASVVLKPFIAGIEQYASAFDIIAGISPEFLSPIWGSFRLAKEYSEYFDKIADMMEVMGLHLSQLRRLPQLFPRNDQLKLFMVEVYQIMFEFCSKARNVFVQASQRKGLNHLRAVTPVGLSTIIKLVWKPFKVQFGDLRDKLGEVMAKIDTEVSLAEKEEAHAERVRAAKDRVLQSSRWEVTEQFQQRWHNDMEENSMEKVTKWLAPVDVLSSHNSSVKLRHGSTGSWFLNSTEFQTWLKDDSSRLFWLHAIPGAGKTVLASSTIQYLKHELQSDEVGLAYFYCDYKDPLKQEPSVVLRTLLSQLSIQNIAVFQNVQNFFKEQCKDDRAANMIPPSLDLIRSNFSSLLETSFHKVFIVIDAVDECHDRECILKAITALCDTVQHVKIFVSSREDPLINEEFKDFPNLRMRPVHVSGDIESYVDATLSSRIASKKLKVKDADLQHQISETLVVKAEGMFQWINCQIDHLCKFKTHNAIRDALKHLPKTLEDTYLRILQNIDEDSTEIVQRLLKWLVQGTRELTLAELASAIAINPAADKEHFDPDDVMDPEDVIGYCGSLVTVSSDQRVSLAHFTVKEFLVSNRIKNILSAYYVGDEEVHAELAQVCLTYLGYRDFDRPPFASTGDLTDFLVEFNFLEYASKSWAKHAHQVSTSELEIHDSIERLFHSNSERRQNYDLWLQIYHFQRRHKNPSIAPPTHFTPLYYAAFFGLPKIIESLLDEGADPMMEDDQVDNPLSASVAEGHANVVEILLNRCFEGGSKERLGGYLYLAASRGHAEVTESLLAWGAPIENKSGKHGTALQVAALEGHPEVVSVLLKRGASIKVVDPRFGTPLSAAAERGHRRVTQLLLDAGASINARGGWFSTPLISAIVGKEDSIINKLLDNGANINAQGGRHDCALMAAAALGRIDLVKKLINLGARVNDENDKGADALHSACCAGRLDVVELLLASGADVNAKGGKHRNALNAASAMGHLEIVQVLLAAGADAQAFDPHYGNCLQAAALNGHKDIVRILAEVGVDLDSDGGVRGTALVCAAWAGNLEMVELLVSLGLPTGNTQDMTNALIVATHKQHESIVRYVISQGADIDTLGQIKSNEWRWALEVAAHKGNQHFVEVLLGLGADADNFGGEYGTALISALDSDHCNHHVVEILLAASVDVNQTVCPEKAGRHGFALNAAIQRADLKAIGILLDHGADPNLLNGREDSPLMHAVNIGNEVIMDLLMEKGADVNICIDPPPQGAIDLTEDTGLMSPLECAAYCDHVVIIRKLVKEGATLAQPIEDAPFKTALQCAAYYGMADSVAALIELGSDVHMVGGTHGSAIQAAAVSGSTECVTLLLDAGADINQHQDGNDYKNPLIGAILAEITDVANLLIDRGADVNLRDGGEIQYAIQAAAFIQDEDLTKRLIETGANVNNFGGKFHSALQAAAYHGNLELITMLLEAGADVNATGGLMGTALQAAYRNGYYRVIWALYDAGASHAIPGGTWGSAFGSAISGACHTLVQQAVARHGVDVNQLCGKWGTPLHFLINQRSDDEVELVSIVLDAGADINAVGGEWCTPLGAAVVEGEEGVFERLLSLGANPNITDEKVGVNPLYLACWKENLEYIDLLLEHGADVNACCRRGSILQRAARGCEPETLEKLVSKGAEINAVTRGPFGTALHAACRDGNLTAVKYLLAHGADTTLKGGKFGSVLQAAAFQSPFSIVRLLLKHGTDVNKTGGKYKTALQAACAAGRVQVAKLLLDNGADVSIAGGRYGSALQAAAVSGNVTLVRLLLSANADPKTAGGWYGSPVCAAAVIGHEDVLKVLLKEEGVSAEMLGEGKPHFKPEKWEGSVQWVEDLQADEEPLEPFDPESIELPDESDDEEEVAISTGEENAESESVSVVASAEESEDGPEPEEGDIVVKVEDMSELSWLQVECGKGGDLDGPGR
ncbi:hypothetical protein G7Y89_g11339 [Cudoniella acicularis]|uniref:NACHT domain-containing protein n=1 Tax=Cudoniella acicularis TaxID=354080 RepID=A0A8H4VY41_9HELO|nr:hypothetical protein G7Y89_g11339 [Cudoniella acicularis]